jgi:hypothetical protein
MKIASNQDLSGPAGKQKCMHYVYIKARQNMYNSINSDQKMSNAGTVEEELP